MQFMTNLAAINSRIARYLLIVLHIPVIVFALIAHTLQGVWTAVYNFVSSILGSGNKEVQGLASTIVNGFRIVFNDIVTVAKGVPAAVTTTSLSSVVAAVKADVASTVASADAEEDALVAKVKAAVTLAPATAVAAVPAVVEPVAPVEPTVPVEPVQAAPVVAVVQAAPAVVAAAPIVVHSDDDAVTG